MIRITVLLFALSLGAVASATVTTTTRTVTFNPCTGATIYSVPYPFIAASHLVVTKTLISNSTVTPLIQGTHYVVALPVGNIQGKVTLTGATCTGTHYLTITRDVPLTQTTSYKTQGSYNAKAHEESFDKLTMMVQQSVAGVAVDSDIATAINNHSAAPDPHTGYHLLAGRVGGQFATGGTVNGENLTLRSTAGGIKGKVIFGNSAYDEANQRLCLGSTTCGYQLTLTGDAHIIGRLGIGTAPVGALDVVGAGTISTRLTTPIVRGYTNTAGGDLELYSTGHASLGSVFIGQTHFAEFDEVNERLAVGKNGPEEELDVQGDAIISGTIYGDVLAGAGGNLSLSSTLNATKGSILLGANSVYDEANGRLGVNTTAPVYALDVDGHMVGRRPVLSAAFPTPTVTVRQCGMVIPVSDVGLNVTLPRLEDVSSGCWYTVIATYASKSIFVTPYATDMIRGKCPQSGAAVDVVFTGAAADDVRDPTTAIGDYINIVAVPQETASGNTVRLGWYVTGCNGVWMN